MPAPTPVQVRGLDRDLWRRLKVESVQHDIPLGQLLNEVIGSWLKHHDCDAWELSRNADE